MDEIEFVLCSFAVVRDRIYGSLFVVTIGEWRVDANDTRFWLLEFGWDNEIKKPVFTSWFFKRLRGLI